MNLEEKTTEQIAKAHEKINDEIKKLQVEENLTIPQLFEKYPHLARLQYEELKEEESNLKEGKKQLKLLLD